MTSVESHRTYGVGAVFILILQMKKTEALKGLRV